MKALLMSAASKIVPDNLLVNIPLDGTYTDRKGLMIPTVMGYPNGQPVFETIDGRPALKVTSGVGIRYQLPANAPKLFAGDSWKLEVDVRFAEPPQFKHDSILAARLSGLPDNMFKLFLWNREQAGNRTIVTGADSRTETAPILIEPTSPGKLVWRKYAIEHTKANNVRTLKLYVNDVMVNSKVVTGDYSSDILDIMFGVSNPLIGWLRDLRVYR